MARQRAALLSGVRVAAVRLATDRPRAITRGSVRLHWMFFPEGGQVGAAVSWRGALLPDQEQTPEERDRRRCLDAACAAMYAQMRACLASRDDTAALRAMSETLAADVLRWARFPTDAPDGLPVRTPYSSGLVHIGPLSAHHCQALRTPSA